MPRARKHITTVLVTAPVKPKKHHRAKAPHLVKGSHAAKLHMARLRAMRRK